MNATSFRPMTGGRLKFRFIRSRFTILDGTFFNSVGKRVQNEENYLLSTEFLIPISFSSHLRNLSLKNVRSD